MSESNFSMTSTTSTNQLITIPKNLKQIVDPHDRPFAEFGHLDPATLRCQFDFNFDTEKNGGHAKKRTIECHADNTRDNFRINAQTIAATCLIDAELERILNGIKEVFHGNIQYVCVATEQELEVNQIRCNVQIILKRPTNKRIRFLDKLTETTWNYHVTKYDKQWNAYIKQGREYIEYGRFQSPTNRGNPTWESCLKGRRMDEHVESTAKYSKLDDSTAEKLIELAEKNHSNAMEYIRYKDPGEYYANITQHVKRCKAIAEQAEIQKQQQIVPYKKFCWRIDFPDCTSTLRRAMNYWIVNHFLKPDRARCLILIGPSGTGKTSFALSLPGPVNYFKGKWCLNKFNNDARYIVIDDVHWNNFEACGFPSKKTLLTCNEPTIASGKYVKPKLINVRKPAIVLLNPEDAGTLNAEPTTENETNEANYWSTRAFIYRMSADEYFVRPRVDEEFDPLNETKYESIENCEIFDQDEENHIQAEEKHSDHLPYESTNIESPQSSLSEITSLCSPSNSIRDTHSPVLQTFTSPSCHSSISIYCSDISDLFRENENSITSRIAKAVEATERAKKAVKEAQECANIAQQTIIRATMSENACTMDYIEPLSMDQSNETLTRNSTVTTFHYSTENIPSSESNETNSIETLKPTGSLATLIEDVQTLSPMLDSVIATMNVINNRTI